jgi:hypothetical protein
VTVTVVTVLFLRVSILDNIYITIYISDIYKEFKRGYTPHFLTVTTVTVTLRPFLPFYLFTFSLTLHDGCKDINNPSNSPSKTSKSYEQNS